MDVAVSHDESVAPGVFENQENRNIQGEPEVLHPAPVGRPVSVEASPFVEMLNRTAIGSGREIDDTFIESGSEYIQEKRSKWELSKTEANNDWFLIGALKAFFIFMSRGDDLVTYKEKDRTPLRNPVEATRVITYLAELNKQGVEIDIHDYAQSGLENAGLSEDADRSEGNDPLAFARGFALGQPEGVASRQAALREFERALSATIALAPDLDAQKQIVAAAVHNVALEAGIISGEGAVNDEDALEYLTTQMNSLWVKSSPVAGGTSYAVLRFADQFSKGFNPDADDFSDIIEVVDKQALTMAGATVTNTSDAGKVLEVKAQFKAQIWGALLGNEEFISKMKTSLSAVYSEAEDLHDLSKTTDTIAQTVTGRISQTSKQASRLRSLDEEFGIDLEQLKGGMPDAMFSILRGSTRAEAAAGTMSLERLHEIAPSLSPEKSMSATELLTAMDITEDIDGSDITRNEDGGDIYAVLTGHGITTDEAGKNIVGSVIGWNKTFTRETLAATLIRAGWHQTRVERFVSEFDPDTRTVAPHADNSTFRTAKELQETLKNSGIPTDQAQVIAANFNPATQMVDTSAVVADAEKGAPALPKDIVLSEVVRKQTSGGPAQVNLFAVFTDDRLLRHSVVSAEMRKGGGCTEVEAKAALFSRWVGYASTDGIMRQYQEMHTYFSDSDGHVHATVKAYGKEGKEARLKELKAHNHKLFSLVRDLAGSEAEAAFENLGFQEISAIDESPLYNQHNLSMEKYYGMLEEALGLDHGGRTGSPTAAAELIEFLTPGVVAYLLITKGRVSHGVYLLQQIENPRLQELHRNMTQQLEGLTSQDVDRGESVSFRMEGREVALSHWTDKAGLQAFKEGVCEAQGVSEALFSKNAPLGSYHSAVGATYAAGVVGENVCDWSHVDPAGFSMDVDGVGHDDSALVAREHPIYAEFASNHARFVRETEVTSKEQYAQALDAQVLSYSQEFRKRKNAYEDDATRGCDVVGAIVRSVMNNVQSGQPALTEEKFLELTELISRQKFEEALRDAALPDLARNCMQAILDKDFDAFNRYAALYKDLDREDPSWMLFHKIKYRNLPKGSSGPAFGMAQFFKAEGQDHLYLNRMADVCFMVIQPKGQERSVNRENITPDQVTWVEEAADQLGLGDQSGEGAKKGTVMAVRPGTIVMTFSDGIGEFLTQEEILEVIKEGHSLERFKEKIMVEDRRDDARMRASNSTTVCKPHDFESAHYHDDVSYSWMVLK